MPHFEQINESWLKTVVSDQQSPQAGPSAVESTGALQLKHFRGYIRETIGSASRESNRSVIVG